MRPLSFAVGSLALAMLTAGCGDDAPASPSAPTPTVRDAPEWSDVSFVACDGVTLHGELARSPLEGAPVALFVHDEGETREAARGLAARTFAYGASVMIFDLRGHGESTEKGDGTRLTPATFDENQWGATHSDVIAALEHIWGDERLRGRPVAVFADGLGVAAASAGVGLVPGLEVRAMLWVVDHPSPRGFEVRDRSRSAAPGSIVVLSAPDTPLRFANRDAADGSEVYEHIDWPAESATLESVAARPDLIARVLTRAAGRR